MRNPKTIFISAITSMLVMSACSEGQTREEIKVIGNSNLKVTQNDFVELLEKRNTEFEKDIIQVSDNVYTAVGYGVSAVSMIVGTDGLIIVDTGIDTISGDAIREDFRNISDLPIKAIILTHGHPDHIGGLSSFMDNPDVQVWASEEFGHEGLTLNKAGITIQNTRGKMQAGFMLTPEQRYNNGIAKAYWPKKKGGIFAGGEKTNPNNFVSEERTTITVSGVSLELVPVGGETEDQVYIWYPEKRVAFSGDNFYKSWPNLYAIRGSAYRDISMWAGAIDAMVKESPVAVIGGHTRPIVGEAEVEETLTNYRDAIQFLFDKTVEGINKGLTPNQLVEYVELTAKYQDLDYLRPYYGNSEWAIRSIFNGYLGWFDGNATNLFPLSDKEEAQRIAKLSGGMNGLLSSASNALNEKDYQWAAQLYDYVLAIEPDNKDALLGKADALTALTDTVLTTTARNYYQSSAQMLRKRASE